MSELASSRSLAAALETLVRDVAPDVLAQALEDARAEAKTILQCRLVEALLEEAGRTVPVAPRVTTGRTVPHRQAVVPPAEGCTRSDPDRAKEQGLYVYGITCGDARRVTGLAGVEDSATYPIVEDGLIAVVSDVRGQRHGWGIGADGEPDLALLAPRLEEHEKVLERVLHQGSVLPMRFGTLYESRVAVSELMVTNGEAIRAALAAVDGKVEWGLTVSWDGQQAAATLSSDDASEVAAVPHRAGSPGRDYLSRRDSEKVQAARLAERWARVSADLHHAIDQVAAASIILPTPRSGHDDVRQTVLRSSYLVAKSDRERFEAVIVEGLTAGAEIGLNGELTGPWPPYNFADLRLDGVPA